MRTLLLLGIVVWLGGTSAILAEEPSKRSVRERLDAKITATFRRTPFFEACETIGKAVDLRVVVDGNALKFEGYTRNMAHDAEFKNVAAGVALTRIVGKYRNMTYFVDELGNRVVVTTEDGLRKLRKPAGDPKEDAAWSSLITSEQLAMAITGRVDAMRGAVASKRAFGPKAKNDARRFVATCQVAARHPDGLPTDVAARLVQSGRAFETAFGRGPNGVDEAIEALAEIEEILRQRRDLLEPDTTKAEAPEFRLQDVMTHFVVTEKNLGATEPPRESSDAMKRLAADVALASAMARLAAEAADLAEDPEFRTHAFGLSEELATTRVALEAGESKAYREALAKVRKRCATCHANFR